MRKKCTALILLLSILLPALASCGHLPVPDEDALFRQFTLDLSVRKCPLTPSP